MFTDCGLVGEVHDFEYDVGCSCIQLSRTAGKHKSCAAALVLMFLCPGSESYISWKCAMWDDGGWRRSSESSHETSSALFQRTSHYLNLLSRPRLHGLHGKCEPVDRRQGGCGTFIYTCDALFDGGLLSSTFPRPISRIVPNCVAPQMTIAWRAIYGGGPPMNRRTSMWSLWQAGARCFPSVNRAYDCSASKIFSSSPLACSLVAFSLLTCVLVSDPATLSFEREKGHRPRRLTDD